MARRARHILPRSERLPTIPGRMQKPKATRSKSERIAFFLSVSIPASKSGKSGKSGKLKVARKSKVAKVENFSKLESRKSFKVERKSLILATVGKLLQSRRVGEIPLSNVICTIVGVVVGVRCDHVFGLILIAKVVFTEENA